jgi:hypothetical protein
MVFPSMCFHNYDDDYIVQKIKKKDIVAYLGEELSIRDVEPSDILVLFLLLLL